MGVLSQLAQTSIPGVFNSLRGAGLVDTMSIWTQTAASDSGGGRVRTDVELHNNVPVTYRASSGDRRIVGDRITTEQQYVLTFPTHDGDGERINIDPTLHRLILDCRDHEPEKTFRVISVSDRGGVVFDAVCIVEG